MSRPYALIRLPAGEKVEIKGHSHMRVALVSDEGVPVTDEQISEALDQVWPMFTESIERRELVAKGSWALGIVDKPENWREHIFGETRKRVEKGLRRFPDAQVVMVVGLFDTGEATLRPYLVEEA